MTPTPTPALDLDALEADIYRRLANWRLALHDRSDLLALIERARQADRLEAQHGMTMGVGDGSGQLFVHGEYDSIKAVQRIVMENASLRTQLAEANAREAATCADFIRSLTHQSHQTAELDDALMKINQALGEALDEATKNAKIHEDHSRRLLIKGAEARQSFEAQLSTYRALIEKAVEALENVSREVLGSLGLFESLVRHEIGNTNYNAMVERAQEARAVAADLTAAIGKGEGT